VVDDKEEKKEGEFKIKDDKGKEYRAKIIDKKETEKKEENE